MTGEIWLSGTDTAAKWHALRDSLGAGEERWDEAYEFLRRRLETRYLEPIWLMQGKLEQRGEGFAIVTLQCALIEFLAALVEGRHYVPGKTDPRWNKHAYKDSAGLFARFLCREQPFADVFRTKAQARDFYHHVRCGLVHEAMTKERWLINVRGLRGIDYDERIVYRDTLQQELEDWLQTYAQRLKVDTALQAACVRKLDHITS